MCRVVGVVYPSCNHHHHFVPTIPCNQGFHPIRKHCMAGHHTVVFLRFLPEGQPLLCEPCSFRKKLYEYTSDEDDTDMTDVEDIDTANVEDSGTTDVEDSDTAEIEDSETTEIEASETTNVEEDSERTEVDDSETTEMEDSETTEVEDPNTAEAKGPDMTEDEDLDMDEDEDLDMSKEEHYQLLFTDPETALALWSDPAQYPALSPSIHTHNKTKSLNQRPDEQHSHDDDSILDPPAITVVAITPTCLEPDPNSPGPATHGALRRHSSYDSLRSLFEDSEYD